MKEFEYERAATVEEAIDRIKDSTDENRLIAGGTALVIMMKERVLSPSILVDISKIDSLRQITYDDKKGLTIGSMATHLEIESSPLVAQYYPTLRDAFHTIGNVRIRAVGTLGGNLAYAEPQCNPPAILAALGATINTQGPNGPRSVQADQFIRGIFESALEPGEVITSVAVPPPMPGSACGFTKFTTKSETDKPTSTVAIYVELDPATKKRVVDCRMVVGAVGPRTYRCFKAENEVKSAPDAGRLDHASIARIASEEFEPMDDLYGPGWYKRDVTTTMIRDTLKRTVDSIRGA